MSKNPLLHLRTKPNAMPQSTIDSFRIRNLVFTFGDLLDPGTIHKSEVIVLPISAEGTATDRVHLALQTLGVKNKIQPLSDLIRTETLQRNVNPRKIIYAASVTGKQTHIGRIRMICIKILQETRNDQFISLPLLGIGAGKLDPILVADDYLLVLASKNQTFIISISDRQVFQKLKKYLSNKSTPVDDSFFGEKPLTVSVIEQLLGTPLTEKNYKLDQQGFISRLYLQDIFIPGDLLTNERLHLVDLGLLNCTIDDLTLITRFQEKLSVLLLSEIRSNDFSFINALKKLKTLQIRKCNLQKLDFLTELEELEALDLSDNLIADLRPLANLANLKQLTILNNKIESIDPIRNLQQLSGLNARENLINEITSLAESPIERLYISNNLVKDVTPILRMPMLKELQVDNNPFLEGLDIILSPSGNHFDTVISYLLRQEEEKKEPIELPVKVLLLGNHATGKSSLLSYIAQDEVLPALTSTHIVAIKEYGKNDYDLPLAIFFDFGGQDYYHGIYRAFLSGGSFTILLWTQSSNENRLTKDANGVLTQDLSLSYWLSQKNYLEIEKFYSAPGPLLLVQTHADQEPAAVNLEDTSGFRIDNSFYLSLNPSEGSLLKENNLTTIARQYLKTLILDQIRKQITTRQEPKWYIDFIRYILTERTQASHEPKNVDIDIFPHYSRHKPDAHRFLRDELDQLHKKGLLLYYIEQMPNDVWLNPEALVKYIHTEILRKDDPDLKGGRVPEAKFAGVSPQIINLLKLQKVIFYHRSGESGPEYIIPNFLPLVEEDDLDTYFYFFGFSAPKFTLKFTHFMPFGLINQLISSFGILPERKKFWRNQLLFTFEGNSKILIKLDSQRLEIKVHIHYPEEPDDKIKFNNLRYLFYLIMTTYWDMHILNFDQFNTFISAKPVGEADDNEIREIAFDHAEMLYEKPECRPSDLYISLDEIHFIEYAQLYTIESPLIATKIKSPDGKLLSTGEAITVYPFEAFTNRSFRKVKKVAISYSKRDLEMVDKFRQYLVPLYDLGLIESPWYCTMLEAGQDWNAEIKERFAQADLIFFMISENLMSNKYVKENEIKNAIDRWEKHKDIKIIPILLQYYDWQRPDKYNLAKFNGFPYSLKPVADFKNQHTAWYMIERSLRMTLEKDLNPLQGDITFTTEMEKLNQEIMKGKSDADL